MDAIKGRLNWAVFTVAGWFPVAVFGLYLKYTEVYRRYFDLMGSISGVSDNPAIVDHLFFFKEDILLNLVIIPLILIALLVALPRNKIVLISIQLLTLSLLVLLYANLLSWNSVGHSLTYTAAVNAITFALSAPPEFIGLYIDPVSRTKFFVLFIATIVFYSSAGLLLRSTILTRLSVLALTGTLLIALFVGSIGYLSNMRGFLLNENFIVTSVKAFFGSQPGSDINKERLTNQQLVNAFKDLTKTDSYDRDHIPYGSSNENDLIIIGLETGSASFMDLVNDLDSFPAIRRLSNNALIMSDHYTTFPTSAESWFSVLSGIYPPRSYYSTCVVSSDEKINKPFPGIVSAFAANNYITSLYLPYKETMPIDIALNENLGYEYIYYADTDLQTEGLSRDKQAFNKMLDDLKDKIQSKVPYVSVFLPQHGHAPWPDKPPESSIKEHGRQVAIQQDRWLLELIALLEKTKRLDHTTIVVLSDHGIRTKHEDPDFRVGFIDEYSFKVPLMIFSRSSFDKKEYINRMTSHIDIAPTLLELHGIKRDISYEQGLPVWSDGIDSRITFYLGDWYFGADAYITNGKSKMSSNVLNVSFSNTKLHFNNKDIDYKREDANNVQNVINKFYGIQQQWVEKFICQQ